MNLPVTLRGPMPAAYLDLNFDYHGETYGATLEGAEAREGHCASRLQLIDTAVRNPDGWFDVPLSDRRIDESVLHKALAIILQEHFDDDLAAYHVTFMP
ncbi:hypothetical protein D3C87_1034660 [compost metagenome]